MTDLIAWLRAQLDEDKRLARLILDHPEQGHGASPVIEDAVEVFLDPVRVLREVEAKRLLIDQHGRYGTICAECGSADDPVQWPCPTLRLLALPYSDRPGYREEWRP